MTVPLALSITGQSGPLDRLKQRALILVVPKLVARAGPIVRGVVLGNRCEIHGETRCWRDPRPASRSVSRPTTWPPSASIRSPRGSILFALHSHRTGAKVALTLKRLLQLAAIDGAVDLGIADRAVSITHGKRADLVLVRTSDVNIAPAGDPCEAIVLFAVPPNVDTVIVDGRILRRGPKFTAIDHGKIVAEARAAALAVRDKAEWPG